MLDPTALRAAAASAREYLISTPAADSRLGVSGDAALTVALPSDAGQVCCAGSEPPPQPVICMTYGTISGPVATNSFGTRLVHGPVPPAGESDQSQSDGTVIAEKPTPKAANASPAAPPPPLTAGKPAVAGGTLGAVRTGTPRLSLKLRAGHGALGLEKLVLAVPRGIAFERPKLRRGVKLTGPTGARSTPPDG